MICERHERCDDGNQSWPRKWANDSGYKNEGSFISCVKNQQEQVALKYRLNEFLEEAPHFVEKQFYDKLNSRGAKLLSDMTHEERV